jgi:hypothetical protein
MSVLLSGAVVFRSDNRALLALLAAACGVVLTLPGNAAAWTWPVEGPVLRPFSTDDDPYGGGQHRGIDVGAPIGTEVRAPASGVVSFAGSVPGAGRALTIRTEDGYSITLLQLDSIAVPVRTAISEGEVVGSVGPSRDAVVAEPHVHLGIRLTAEPHGYLDPLTLLPARRSKAAEPAPAPAPAPVAVPASAPEAPAAQAAPQAPATAADPPPPSVQVSTAAPAVGQPRTRSAEQPAHDRRPRGRARTKAKRQARASAEPVRPEVRPLRATRRSPVSRPRLRRPAPRATPNFRTPTAEQTDPAAPARPRAQPSPAPEEAAPPSRFLLALACSGLALCVVGVSRQFRRDRIPARRFEEKALRKMSETPTGPEVDLAEPQLPTDSRRRRLALCERTTAHRPCRRLRRSFGHLCALPPAPRQRRAHGQWHRRARNARDGRRRPRGRVTA